MAAPFGGGGGWPVGLPEMYVAYWGPHVTDLFPKTGRT